MFTKNDLENITTANEAISGAQMLKDEAQGYRNRRAANEDLSNDEIKRSALIRGWVGILEDKAKFFTTFGIEPSMITEGASDKQISYARSCSIAATGYTNRSDLCDTVLETSEDAQKAIKSACKEAAKNAKFWLDIVSDQSKLRNFAIEAAKEFL